ncbi:MAG: ABC transporter permease [Chloroflexi bacterium]|nr:ABC transporter permease [Chloroflexota bacterium]MCY4112234.1 ABC transporter permease [Chloroflexota bacterium]
MRSALVIAGKDLRQRARDRSVYVFAIVAPLGLAAIFGFVFNPISDADFTATFAVANVDQGPLAAPLVDGVLGGLADDGNVNLVHAASAEEATRLVEGDGERADQDVDAAIIIPAGFSARVQTGQPAELRVVQNANASLASTLALAIVQEYARQLDYVQGALTTVISSDPARLVDAAAIAERAGATPSPVSVQDVSATIKQLDSTTFYAAGLATFFLFFTVQFGVNSLLEERHAGTLSRLLAAPVPKGSIILGKAMTAFGLGVVSMLIMIVATSFILGADWGNPVGVALLVVAATASAIGVMAMVSALARTSEQGAVFSSIAAVVLGILGGTFFPINQAGGVLASLRFVAPHAWFLQGLGDLAGGALGDIVPGVAALLVFTVVTSGIALVLLRRRLNP